MIGIAATSLSLSADTGTEQGPGAPITRLLTAEQEAAIALSRNTSVISTGSSSSSSSSVALPPRPRPVRTYTGPRATNVPDVLPASPTTPKATQRNFDDYPLPTSIVSTPSRNGTPTSEFTGANAGSIDAQMAHAIAMGGSSLSVPGSALGSAISSGFNTPTRISPTPGSSTPNGARSRQPSSSNTAQNYRFEGVLGEGSYSTVFTATSLINQQVYAVKVISKRLLQKENKARYANSERSILSKLGAANHPGIIRLHSAFHDVNSLYFVLELAPNGELFTHLRRLGSFNIQGTQYYAATILDAVSFIHRMNIIHRDLKPENILLDANMRIKISDFGTAKDKAMLPPDDNVNSMKRKGSFVGTPEYASPEMLVPPTITTRASDIWAYGCIVFQFISGRPPFKEGTDYLTMKKIQEGQYEFPEGFDLVIKTLVQSCLVINPVVRITGEALHVHPFFESINWETLWKETPPVLESGLVKPPENVVHAMSLNWSDIEGSEDEMEDLLPRQDECTEQVGKPMQVASKNGALELESHRISAEEEADLGVTPTSRSQHISRAPSASPPSPLDYRSKGRRFSQSSDTARRRASPTPNGAVKSSGLNAGVEMDFRPRRMSPSLGGLPSANIHSRSRPLGEEDEGNVIEDDSEPGSGEGPSSTVEEIATTTNDTLKETSLSPIRSGSSGGMLSLANSSGHAKSSSPHSSVDMTLISTSGTSGASGASASMNAGAAKGFEKVRGVRGVELEKETPKSAPKDVAWLLTSGQTLLGPSERCIYFTPVTIRTKRGLLPAKQRRRLLILTSSGRLICVKELKSSSGKRSAQLEDEMFLPSYISETSRAVEKEGTANPTDLSPTNANRTGLHLPTPKTDGNTNASSPANSPSKRPSVIGLPFSSGSSITSALPNLTLSFPGSTRTLSNVKPHSTHPDVPGGRTDTTEASRLAVFVSKVEPKGEMGFVVSAGDRVVVYTVNDHGAMMEWVDKLKAALESR